MTDANRVPTLADLQRIEWDEGGYADFHDAGGYHRCPNVSTAGDTVFVDDLTSAYLTAEQAREVAARLLACAEEVS